MTRGDTYAFTVTISGLGDTAIDHATMTVKKNATDETAQFAKTEESGIAITDETLAIRIAPEDTKTLDAGTYAYDIQIQTGEDIHTIIKGAIEIEQDVTF